METLLSEFFGVSSTGMFCHLCQGEDILASFIQMSTVNCLSLQVHCFCVHMAGLQLDAEQIKSTVDEFKQVMRVSSLRKNSRARGSKIEDFDQK